MAIDSIGPVKETIKGNKHILILIDVFSKFIEAKPLPDLKASSCINFLLEYVGRYGLPKKIMSDNGPQFNNRLFKEVQESFGIETTFSTPEHSRGNAVVERDIQTFQEKLSILMGDKNTQE